MFSNLPTMLQDQDFQTRHADMLAAAREGKIAASKAAPLFACDREGIIVEASNQQGQSLVVYPLREALDIGTILNIENVTRWRREWDDVVPCDFVLTKRAEKGDRILHLYPPIETPKTVNHLPMHGSVVTVKEPEAFAADVVFTLDCSVGDPVPDRGRRIEPKRLDVAAWTAWTAG